MAFLSIKLTFIKEHHHYDLRMLHIHTQRYGDLLAVKIVSQKYHNFLQLQTLRASSLHTSRTIC